MIENLSFSTKCSRVHPKSNVISSEVFSILYDIDKMGKETSSCPA